MNIKEILIKKAEYPVRLIASEDSIHGESILWFRGNEFGIEVIDFSSGSIRMCNKSVSRAAFPTIIQVYYDKESGELKEKFEFKPTFCTCDFPIIRISESGGEYCGDCGKDLSNE